MICNNIIRACPFCEESPRVRNNIGNLKHLHLYCSSTHWKKARTHCYQKIELALQNLYDYASIIEFDCPLYECLQKTILQERMETAAREAELLSRPVIRNSRLIYEQRIRNHAIRSCRDVQLAVLLHRLPPEKLEEYTTYPLMAQLGFIHAIPEEEFDISTATITDISFIGLFLKMVFQAMKNYERECPNRNFNSGECYSLMDAFVKDFVHRTITIQKVVHILVSHQKAKLALLVSP